MTLNIMLATTIILLSICQTLTKLKLYDQLFNTIKAGTNLETALTSEDFTNAVFAASSSKTKHGNKFDPDTLLYRKERFEGDIVGNTVKNLPTTGHKLPIATYRSSVKEANRIWPSPRVPYTISSHYSSYSRALIASAFEEYSRKTCVEFIPRTTEVDYLFIEPGDGCFSQIGRTGGKQVVSLGLGCLQKGIVQHELMHTLGFFHEQSRIDRDEYVDILWENIDEEMRDQFLKYSHNIMQLVGDYDYASIMHYATRAFSKNGKPTIKPKKELGFSIGQRIGFSVQDVDKIRLVYKCNKTAFEALLESTVLEEQVNGASSANDTGDNGTTVIDDQSNFASICIDQRSDCSFLKLLLFCESHVDWMHEHCNKTCNFDSCASWHSSSGSSLQKSMQAARPVPAASIVTSAAANKCANFSPFCTRWSDDGYCDSGNFQDYMTINCRKACKLCWQG